MGSEKSGSTRSRRHAGKSSFSSRTRVDTPLSSSHLRVFCSIYCEDDEDDTDVLEAHEDDSSSEDDTVHTLASSVVLAIGLVEETGAPWRLVVEVSSSALGRNQN